jgi:hypothetical protein
MLYGLRKLLLPGNFLFKLVDPVNQIVLSEAELSVCLIYESTASRFFF